jgi:hypothetical protein
MVGRGAQLLTLLSVPLAQTSKAGAIGGSSYCSLEKLASHWMAGSCVTALRIRLYFTIHQSVAEFCLVYRIPNPIMTTASNRQRLTRLNYLSFTYPLSLEK